MAQELITIIGEFNPDFKIGPCLELAGPFDQRTIAEVIRKFRMAPYIFFPEHGKKNGRAAFLVKNPEKLLRLPEN